MKNPRGEAERWLKQAEYDLRAAEHDADGEYYSVACFKAQTGAIALASKVLATVRKSLEDARE